MKRSLKPKPAPQWLPFKWKHNWQCILNKHLNSKLDTFGDSAQRSEVVVLPQYYYMSWLCPLEDWKYPGSSPHKVLSLTPAVPSCYFNHLYIKGPMETVECEWRQRWGNTLITVWCSIQKPWVDCVALFQYRSPQRLSVLQFSYVC